MSNRFPDRIFCAFLIPNGADGQPLNTALPEFMPETQPVEKMIAGGHIFYNGMLCNDPAQTVRSGDWGWLYCDSTNEAGSSGPQAMIPQVVTETDDYIVVDKPCGMACQEAKSNRIPHLLAWWHAWDGSAPLYPVHRLDVPASGLVVLAKNQKMAAHLSTQFRERTVGRAYRARLADILEVEVGEELLVDASLTHQQGRVWVDPVGRVARTRVRVFRRGASFDDVLVHLETGRFHQIRVHMAHIDAPIVGDTRYGGPRADRLYLHAAKLEFATRSGARECYESVPSWEL